MKTKLSKQEKAELAKKKKEEDQAEQFKRDGFLEIIQFEINQRLEKLRDDDSRLDFLTEIFCLTEEIRDAISHCDPVIQMQDDRKENVPSKAGCGSHCDHCREGGSDGVPTESSEEESTSIEEMMK